MSYDYAPPYNLAGIVAGLNVALTWSPSIEYGTAPLLMLHFDGGTSDSSPAGNTVLVNSGAANGSPKFGLNSFATTGANLFDSYALGVPFATNGPLDIFATPEWTIEAWVNLTTTGGMEVFDYGGSLFGGVTSNLVFFFNTDGTTNSVSALDYAAFGTGATIVVSNTTNAAPGNWHHVALVSHSGTVHIYLDGVAGTIGGSRTDWTPANYGAAGAKNVVVGSSSRFSGGTTPGLIDDFRVTGFAQYTANFTPPTAPFPNTGTEAPGYEIFRGGVSIGTFTGPSTHGWADTVPGSGVYTYTVAGWDGTVDVSAQSAPLVLTIGAIVQRLYGKFAGAKAFLPTLLIDAKGIKPRIYMPHENTTVQT